MDQALKKTVVESTLNSMINLPRTVSGSEVQILERLVAQVEKNGGVALRARSELIDQSIHEEVVAKNKHYEKLVVELQGQIELLSQRVKRRDEAIQALHRRLTIEVVQVRGSDQGRHEASRRCREQEDDAVRVAVALREKIEELEKAVQSKCEELAQCKSRAGADHEKFKAQVERNEQLIFDFNEKLRGLEYEKKSSTVIVAAKDRIIERSQKEIVAIEEKLFNEKKRYDKLVLDTKLEAQIREEERALEARRQAEAAIVEKDLSELQVKHAALEKKFESLSAENLQTQNKFAELWRRLDSGGGSPNEKSPASPLKGGGFSGLLTTTVECSDSDDSNDEEDTSPDIKVKLLGTLQKSPLQHRNRSGKRDGKTRSPSKDPIRPSDLILRHNSMHAENFNDVDEDYYDYGNVNLARIGLAAPGRNDSAQPVSEDPASGSTSKYTKSILASRRDKNNIGQAAKKVADNAEMLLAETSADPVAPLFSAPRPRSAVGSFAKQWASGGKVSGVATVRPKTTPYMVNRRKEPETEDSASELDHFPGPDDATYGKAPSRKTPMAARRKKSRCLVSTGSPSSRKAFKASSHDFGDSVPASPAKQDQEQIQNTEPRTDPQNTAELEKRPVKTSSNFRKTRLTVRTITSSPKPEDQSAESRAHALQVGLNHKQKQLEEEQKFFTSQIVKLKSANDSLTEQVAELERRLSMDYSELSHERDELHRTVTYLSEQLASSTFNKVSSPMTVETPDGQKSNRNSFNWGALSSTIPAVEPRAPVSAQKEPQKLASNMHSRIQVAETGTDDSIRAATSVAKSLPTQSLRGDPSSGRRRGKVGSEEIFLPSFVEEPLLQPSVQSAKASDELSKNEASSSKITPMNVIEATREASDTMAKVSAPPSKTNKTHEQDLCVAHKPKAVTLGTSDAAVGNDDVLPIYQDVSCQCEPECDAADGLAPRKMLTNNEGHLRILVDKGDSDDADDAEVTAARAAYRQSLANSEPAADGLYEESSLARVFQCLLNTCAKVVRFPSSAWLSLEAFVAAGMALRVELVAQLINESDNEHARTVSIFVRCYDLIFVHLHSILQTTNVDEIIPPTVATHSVKNEKHEAVDVSLPIMDVAGGAVCKKEFYYRGASFSAPATACGANVTGVVEQTHTSLELVQSDGFSQVNAMDLSQYDIYSVYDFAHTMRRGGVDDYVEDSPRWVIAQSTPIRPYCELKKGHSAPDDSVWQEGSMKQYNSREITVQFPMVRQLAPNADRRASASFLRPRSGSSSERGSRMRDQRAASYSSRGGRSPSVSPAMDITMGGCSTILYGEAKVRSLAAPSNEQSHEATAPPLDMSGLFGARLEVGLSPSAPTSDRTTASITSPRPKSALSSSRKGSYKLDPSVGALPTPEGNITEHGARPITAPEKRVVFAIRGTIPEDRAVGIEENRGYDNDDLDSKSIYQQLMSDFESHFSNNPTMESPSAVKPLLDENRRKSTNMYKDARGAFQPASSSIGSFRRHSEWTSPTKSIQSLNQDIA